MALKTYQNKPTLLSRFGTGLQWHNTITTIITTITITNSTIPTRIVLVSIYSKIDRHD